jgi:hypothetical protein
MDHCVLRRDERNPRRTRRLSVSALRAPDLMACERWGVRPTRRNRAAEIAGNYGLLVLLI